MNKRDAVKVKELRDYAIAMAESLDKDSACAIQEGDKASANAYDIGARNVRRLAAKLHMMIHS